MSGVFARELVGSTITSAAIRRRKYINTEQNEGFQNEIRLIGDMLECP